MNKPTLEEIRTKHQTALQLLYEFEQTIPHLSEISRDYAPRMVNMTRSQCHIIVANVFGEPSETTQNLKSMLLEKTGIESADMAFEEIYQKFETKISNLDERMLISANDGLDKLLIEIRGFKERYL
ncbi:MAG: hypothetical protein JWM20_205 [Patescibacteria group bacterium]|nr:hypothetical protein [Patescibacteria group bacterium]